MPLWKLKNVTTYFTLRTQTATESANQHLLLCNKLFQTTMAWNKDFFFGHHHFVGQELRLTLVVCFGLGAVGLAQPADFTSKMVSSSTNSRLGFLGLFVSLEGL